MVTCPTELVFSGKSKNCVWADEAGRTGCSTAGGKFWVGEWVKVWIVV